MKIKQIAIRVPNIIEVKNNLEKLLGAKFSVDDVLDMDGFFANNSIEEKTSTVGDVELSFDYNLLKDCDEFELISVDDENHWHSEFHKSDSVLSHLGIYCESESELEAIVEKFRDEQILQDSMSYNHLRTNSDGSERSYRDVILDTRSLLGFNLKITYKYQGDENDQEKD